MKKLTISNIRFHLSRGVTDSTFSLFQIAKFESIKYYREYNKLRCECDFYKKHPGFKNYNEELPIIVINLRKIANDALKAYEQALIWDKLSGKHADF